MRRRTFIKRSGTAGLAILISPLGIFHSVRNPDEPSFEKNFQTPPSSAFPWTYWFWMNSHISKQGITQDLEAMKRTGIGGVFHFDVGTGMYLEALQKK